MVMRLTAKLALSQLKINRSRTILTLIGIALSTAMITAVFGLVASGMGLVDALLYGNPLQYAYRATLFGLGAILNGLVVIASIIVVSNTFRVSAAERRAQFGMLKSVGATGKQIAETIVYEGVFLNVVGIPVGVVFGLFVHYIGVLIINFFLYDLNAINEETLAVYFVLAPVVILMSVLVAFGTILLAAYFPARKAAKISAIDAIRGAGEVKINAKSFRANPLIKLIFDYEGVLASKSLKRSRRNFRATVLSLGLSVILFIAVGAVASQMGRLSALVWHVVDASAGVGFLLRSVDYSEDTAIRSSRPRIGYAEIEPITERLRAFADVIGIGSVQGDYSIVLRSDELGPGTLTHRLAWNADWLEYTGEHTFMPGFVVLDAVAYAEAARLAGVPYGSNILLNFGHSRLPDDRRIEITPLIFTGQTLELTRSETLGGGTLSLPLHGQLTRDNIPRELIGAGGEFAVIIPSADVQRHDWFVTTTDNSGFLAYARNVLEEHGISDIAYTWFVDFERDQAIMRNLSRLVMTLTYGFIALLTVIGLTNVVSTISANLKARSREFAVLKSIGMTESGIGKMLSLESLLCSARALFIGIPLGILASYGTHHAIGASAEFAYTLPWLPIIQSVIGVFLITWLVMRFSALRLQNGNIVNTIRGDSGM